jgi:hypothetical protein
VTVPLDRLGRERPTRAFELNARTRAMAAARKLLEAKGRFNRDEIAEEFETTASIVSLALVILKFGTEAEIVAADTGHASIRGLYDDICKRVPVEERIKAKTTATMSANRREQIKNDAQLWKELRHALDLICGMPQPADVVRVARANSARTAMLDRKIIDAYTWLSEFSDAWTK